MVGWVGQVSTEGPPLRALSLSLKSLVHSFLTHSFLLLAHPALIHSRGRHSCSPRFIHSLPRRHSFPAPAPTPHPRAARPGSRPQSAPRLGCGGSRRIRRGCAGPGLAGSRAGGGGRALPAGSREERGAPAPGARGLGEAQAGGGGTQARRRRAARLQERHVDGRPPAGPAAPGGEYLRAGGQGWAQAWRRGGRHPRLAAVSARRPRSGPAPGRPPRPTPATPPAAGGPGTRPQRGALLPTMPPPAAGRGARSGLRGPRAPPQPAGGWAGRPGRGLRVWSPPPRPGAGGRAAGGLAEPCVRGQGRPDSGRPRGRPRSREEAGPGAASLGVCGAWARPGLRHPSSSRYLHGRYYYSPQLQARKLRLREGQGAPRAAQLALQLPRTPARWMGISALALPLPA